MNLFTPIWKLITRVTLVIGVFLSFLVLLELLRFFVFLYRLEPVLAWTFTGFVGVGVLVAALYVGGQLRKYPAPLKPPHLPPPGEATHQELKRYANYLITYQKRLAQNPNVPAPLRDVLLDEIETQQGLIGHHPLNEDLTQIIDKSTTQLLPPIHQALKEQSEKEIRRSVRDVMLGVTLSPYHSADLLIVLYRNFAMIFRVMAVYETRPSPRAQLRILRDVLRVVATVNFLYVGRNLIENLFAFVPWVGRVADDIGQGLGAGLFTSACGHAVIDRCSSYREWQKAAAVESLASQSRSFIRDVKNIFTKDVLPDIKNRIMSEAPAGQINEPGFWDNLQKGVNNAFDATLKTLGSILPTPDQFEDEPVPAPAGGAPRPRTHTPPDRPYPHAPDYTSSRRIKRRRGVSRVLHTFGQRVKYTLGLGRE
jgi:uncharacterized membrane protein YcjF (UPF0283 family)